MSHDQTARVGFIQGRLCAPVEGRIQAFPWDEWREEFPRAAALGFGLMEWTLDFERLDENPIMTAAGRREIALLAREYGLSLPSLTGDFAMQAPYHRISGLEAARRLETLKRVLDACGSCGISILVVPLVDEGSIASPEDLDRFLEGMGRLTPQLGGDGPRLALESDFPPARLARFMEDLDPDRFGVNYDIGNSAALGYDPRQELAAYGQRVTHVHIKDRRRGGGTVPLGQGDADLPGCLRKLAATGYAGLFILQTARAADGDHAGALAAYRDLTVGWIEEAYGPGA